MEKQNLTRQELIDYFKDVFELEKQLYTYEMLEQEYEEMLIYIGVPRDYSGHITKEGIPSLFSSHLHNLYLNSRNQGIAKNWLMENYSIEKPEWLETQEYQNIINIQPNDYSTRNKNAHLIWILICIIIVIGLIVSLGFFSVIWLTIPIVLFYLVGSVFVEYMFPISNKEFVAKEAKIKTYFEECTKKEAIIIVENEKPLRRNIENTLIESVIKPKESSKILLDRLYSQNIIFPKYRNFASVAQIYEYLLSGRCDQLEGPNGAYNLYESELRQNIIIDKLDEIIWQLENLNRTMSMICGAIQETNHLLRGISSSLNNIDANTSLIAYNTQCIAYNSQIANKYVL